MSSIYVNDRTYRSLCRAALLSVLFAMLPAVAFAQNTGSLSMTLTPPLFQVTQAPGSTWSSVLRVVNTNDYDLRVTATVMDFRPDGETGNAVFSNTAVAAPTDTHLMSGWFSVRGGDILIKRGTTGEIPFSISVPANADPGGHYAAILVGSHQEEKFSGSGAGVSSAISSLFFLRVPGDVVEAGAIRDFYAERSVVDSPDTQFALRFENTGNVHLVPEGSIIITNMWGKERGKININTVNTFGNVLPGSTRKFEFDWHGEPNIFEFGRYTALATLVYGTDARKTVYRTAYFWVIPWKQVIPLGIGLGGFIWFITWSIRRYIRKALALERARLGISEDHHAPAHHTKHPASRSATPTLTLEILRRPLVEDVQPTHRGEKGAHHHKKKQKSWIVRQQKVIGFFLIVFLGFGLIGWYFVEVFHSERSYQMQQIKHR